MDSFISILKAKRTDPQFQAIIGLLPDLIIQVSRDGIVRDFYSIRYKFAVADELVIGRNLTQLFPAHVVKILIAHINQFIETGRESVFEYFFSGGADGRQFEANIIPLRQDDVTILIRDVTEKRKLEREEAARNRVIADSELKFRLLAENLPGAVYLCDNDAAFSMLYLNEKILNITGYTSAEFLDGTIDFSRLYYQEDIPGIYKQVEAALATKTSFQLVYRIRDKSGQLRWVEEFGAGVYDGDRLICLEGYLQDISARKDAETKILEQNQALIKTNSELDRFVYSASHDLRSPLSSLLGLLNLCEKNDLEEDLRLYLKLMRDQINNLDGFVRDITYYSQNARLDLEETEIKLSALVVECLEGLQHAVEAEGVRFDIRISPDTVVVTDRRRLKVVLNNLFSNAIKYTDMEKMERFLRVSYQSEDDRHVIIVEDNGIGIEPEYQSRIFDMFYRASEQSKGSGLGLYIAKEAIAKMKGTIEMKSTFSKGTEFRIFITKKMTGS